MYTFDILFCSRYLFSVATLADYHIRFSFLLAFSRTDVYFRAELAAVVRIKHSEE